MFVPLVFWSLLLGAVAIGWQAGDPHDRKVILAIVTAAGLTAASDLLVGGRAALALVGLIDIALLVLVVRYALFSQRHWPIWFAGIHATAVVFGFAALLFPTGQRTMLDLISGFWAIPALFVMVAGLLSDQRHGIVNAAR